MTDTSIPVSNIQRPFLAQFVPALLLGVSAAATRTENYCVRIGNDYNSDGEHNSSENGRSAWGALYDTNS
jgi:hypothetical protein